MEHMAALERPSQEGRAWCHGTRGSTEAHLIMEVWSRAEGHVIAARAHLSKEAMSKAAGHVAAPELTSSMRQGLELRDTW
jgi:hypothetical protein